MKPLLLAVPVPVVAALPVAPLLASAVGLVLSASALKMHFQKRFLEPCRARLLVQSQQVKACNLLCKGACTSQLGNA